MLNWLQPWLTSASPALEKVAGDASFRCYYRLPASNSRFQEDAIIMDAPPEKESSERFLHLLDLWQQAGIAVPRLYASSLDEGFALLEDLGDRQFMQVVAQLTPAAADPYYRQALDHLAHLQQASIPDEKLPAYDYALLKREVELFNDWLLDRLLQYPQEQRPDRWELFCEQLIQEALEQPRTRVHRDYHSRNLMLVTDNRLGIIDFQDAVLGPYTYDLVSLVRDCYLDWPQQWQDNWLQYFHQQAGITTDEQAFRRHFDWMGMQRHLKAAGIFARLWLRDGKPGYLQDLPLTLQHLSLALKNYPQWADIQAWLDADIIPRVSQYLQYRDSQTIQEDA
ncbi:aminoglycoside phosphotransferase family protein [Marinospirillum perlucidum]|uniref:aminoglycoside phosphotransferase family protein n=1 Tax=Marinospirillum perlucidum TaxID=1982602 RepID=UPI00138FB2D8|nr:phosphotransferase [Marinospirillum perlucidum]